MVIIPYFYSDINISQKSNPGCHNEGRKKGGLSYTVLNFYRYAGAGIWTRVESLEGSRARPDYTTPA